MDRSIAPLSSEKPVFTFPANESRTLSNGMHVLFLHDASSPLISISLTMRTGAVHEKISGLSRACAGLMMTGTSTKTARDINMLIDRLGISFSYSASWDSFECSSIGLADHRNAIIELMSETLFDSQFQEYEIALKKDLMLAEHEQYAMDPEYLASRALSARSFVNHPYGSSRLGIPSSIKQIDRNACKQWHQHILEIPDAFFTIAGNCHPDEIMPLLEKAFGNWKSKGILPEIMQATYNDDMKCIIAPKADAVQTALHIAFPSIGIHHPDYALFRIASTAFGGYFASRINHTLREVYGYTYGAFAQNYGRKGANTYNIQTQIGNDVTAHGIELIFEEIQKMREYPLKEEEFETVRNYVLGTMIQGMETYQQISARMKMLEFNHLPKTYHADQFDAIAKAEINDVFEIQQTYFKPLHCVISASGAQDIVTPILEQYGETIIFQEA
jgi:predicted Zn-dependent peptidase